MKITTQAQLEQLLEHITWQLNVGTWEEDAGHYAGLYPAGLSEQDIAAAAPRFPTLHPQLARLVECILKRPEYPFWVDEETQAGHPVSLALALYDKSHCGLLARCLAQQDLNHETNQNDDIRRLLEKWGPCAETAQVVAARQNNLGQHGPEIVQELLGAYPVLEDLLESEPGEGPGPAVPSISAAQIEKTKKPAQLEKLYWLAETDFINEWQPAMTDVILTYCEDRHKQGREVAITALALTLQPAQNRIVVSITDDAGNTQEAYASLKVGCLVPFDMLCGRLGHRTDKRVKVLAQKYLPSGAFDGGLARPYKFDAVLEGGYPRTPQGAGA